MRSPMLLAMLIQLILMQPHPHRSALCLIRLISHNACWVFFFSLSLPNRRSHIEPRGQEWKEGCVCTCLSLLSLTQSSSQLPDPFLGVSWLCIQLKFKGKTRSSWEGTNKDSKKKQREKYKEREREKLRERERERERRSLLLCNYCTDCSIICQGEITLTRAKKEERSREMNPSHLNMQFLNVRIRVKENAVAMQLRCKVHLIPAIKLLVLSLSFYFSLSLWYFCTWSGATDLLSFPPLSFSLSLSLQPTNSLVLCITRWEVTWI